MTAGEQWRQRERELEKSQRRVALEGIMTSLKQLVKDTRKNGDLVSAKVFENAIEQFEAKLEDL